MRDLELRVQAKKAHPLEWVLEPLESHPQYLRKRFFGCEAVYINGKFSVAVTVDEEPWNGLLVITHKEQHAALLEEWKSLMVHPVLGKWLYISQNDPAFEKTAMAVVKSVMHGDERIGVEPKPRKRKGKKGVAGRKEA